MSTRNNKCLCNCGKCSTTIQESKFKVGDKVYSPIFGWGAVKTVGNTTHIIATQSRDNWWFDIDGRLEGSGEVLLFHDKPTITPAKKKVKKWRWAYTCGMKGCLEACAKGDITRAHYTEKEVENWVIYGKAKEIARLPWTEIEVDVE